MPIERRGFKQVLFEQPVFSCQTSEAHHALNTRIHVVSTNKFQRSRIADELRPNVSKHGLLPILIAQFGLVGSSYLLKTAQERRGLCALR